MHVTLVGGPYLKSSLAEGLSHLGRDELLPQGGPGVPQPHVVLVVLGLRLC
jgi:hypothetical protein